MIHVRHNPKSGAVEHVEPIGSQMLAAYEADLVAKCEQKRIAIARPAAVRVARFRSEIDRIDHWMARDAASLAATDAARSSEADAGRFEKPWPTFAYWLAMIAIATSEVWVNKLAFDYAASDNIGSFALAASASAYMFMLGKFTAKLLRQKPWRQGDWNGVWLAVPCNLLILGLAWFIGTARATMATDVAASKHHALVPGIGFGFALFMLLGYVAMLYASYWFVDPSSHREQLDAREDRLRPKVDGLCRQREKLASEHNQLVVRASLELEQMVQDCIERVTQFRDGNFQQNPHAPSWFRLALPTAMVKPIHIGELIDTDPRVMGDILANA